MIKINRGNILVFNEENKYTLLQISESDIIPRIICEVKIKSNSNTSVEFNSNTSYSIKDINKISQIVNEIDKQNSDNNKRDSEKDEKIAGVLY